MTDLRDVSIKVKNYKGIGADEQGYDGIRSVNLIIGRNNTGKSTLLDLIEYATSPSDRDLSAQGHRGLQSEVTVTNVLLEEELRPVFQEDMAGGNSITGNHWDFGRRWIGKPITWKLEPGDKHEFVALDPPLSVANPEPLNQSLARQNNNPFRNYGFRKLLADRDISPEPDRSIGMATNGDGATNTIQHFLNKASLPTQLVNETFLSRLNEIFEPDATFTGIDVQQLEDERWEVYLAETEKGPIPLSQSGSGIKTILLVLVCLYLIPHVEGRFLGQYLFGFEELENNLHPALQRRLLLFLREVAVQEGCKFFLTTHSNVAIDLFANDDRSQIVHVTHDRRQATVRTVTTYVDNRGILDDLDVRASDLLQANGVVWVEGPSDRIYFNRWMELVSGGQIREGAHYQCVFYGGKLLAHLSGVDPDVDAGEAVKIFEVNRNAIVILDSDKRESGQALNETKHRIISEIEEMGNMAWVTAGREIENYLPGNALESLYSVDPLPLLEPFADIAAYLDKIKDEEGAKYLRNKVLFAGKIIPHITRHDLQVLDLEDKIAEAHQRILAWNRASRNEDTSVLIGA